MSQLETTVDRDLEQATDEQTDEGERDKFSHVVAPASAVTEAYITGRFG